MPKEVEYVRFKNFEAKIKSSFMIYAGFERNSDESDTNNIAVDAV